MISLVNAIKKFVSVLTMKDLHGFCYDVGAPAKRGLKTTSNSEKIRLSKIVNLVHPTKMVRPVEIWMRMKVTA